jgi:5,10-methylenetetrahydromethanopterin reductase
LTLFHLGFPSPSIADLKMPDNAALARLSEELGFDALWHSNQRFYREMFIRMASSAISTSRIGLGGAIAEPFAVHPILTAQSLATVDELSGGRATLALGAGGSGFQMMGIKRQRPALALREAYGVMKRLLAGEEVTFDGEIIKTERARLQFTSGHPIPLWIATRGDWTLESSGEYADAILIATYATSYGIREAMGLIEKGAKRAGRTLADLRLMSRVDTCVHFDAKLAYDGTRLMIARFLWSSYPDRNFVKRAGLSVPVDIEVLIARREYDLVPQAAALISDEFVEAFCWAGTPQMVAERVIAVARETGIKEFGFWMLLAPGQSREEAVRLIATEVLPLVRAELD